MFTHPSWTGKVNRDLFGGKVKHYKMSRREWQRSFSAGRKISTKTLVSGSKVLYLLFRQVFYNFLTGIFSSWLTNVPLKKESLMPPGEIGREKEAQINWRSRDEVCLESVWLLWESLNLFALFINLWSNNFPLFVDCLFPSREEINPEN